MCVCVCVCVCARVCVCVRGSLQNRQAKNTELRARPNDQSTKHVKTDGLESIHLKHSLYLKVNENSWEKIVSIFCLSDRLELLQC